MTATQAPTPGPLSGDDWIDMAEAPHAVPILAQYNEFNDPSRPLAEHVVWFYASEWRPYPQTVGSAFADRWKHLPSATVAPTAPVEASGSEREDSHLASIAESLKRIADLLDGTTAGICVTETLLGGRRIDQ